MVLAIAFMYLCASALIPFIAFALWCAFDGDRSREPQTAVPDGPVIEPRTVDTRPVSAHSLT